MNEIKNKKNYICHRVPNGDGVTSAKYKYVKRAVDEVERNTVATTEDSDYEQRRVNSLLHVIFKICELSGFWVEERIVLKDRKTGKIWR